MTTLTSAIKVGLTSTLAGAPNLGTAAANLAYSKNNAFTAGAGLDQCNLIYAETITLAASATQTLDLTALTDNLGNAIAFAKVKGLLIVAAVANTNNVLVGNAASNAWFAWCDAATDVIKVLPGGVMLLVAPTAAGFAVTASTAMNLKLANSSSGTAVTFDIMILGA